MQEILLLIIPRTQSFFILSATSHSSMLSFCCWLLHQLPIHHWGDELFQNKLWLASICITTSHLILLISVLIHLVGTWIFQSSSLSIQSTSFVS